MFEQFGAPAWADLPGPRPPGYEYLVRSGLAGSRIRPWMILTLDEVARGTNMIKELFPSRNLVAFAVRTDQLDMACWDADSVDHRIYSIDSYDSGEKWAYMQCHNSLSNWLRAALTMCQEDDLLSWYGRLSPGVRPEDLDKQHDELRPHPDKSSFGLFKRTAVPDWLRNLTYDPYYQIMEFHDLTSCDFPPWRFLSESDILRTSITLYQLLPEHRFVPCARHCETGALACWDASRRDYTVYVLDRWWQRREVSDAVTFPDLFSWQRQALEDFIAAGPQVPNWLSRDGYKPFED